MTSEELLRGSLVALEVNGSFSEALLQMQDASRLWFCHRVDERRARAEPGDQRTNGPTVADALLGQIKTFRLNGKHLDIQFADGSRWEAKFNGRPGVTTM
jgi:hypothetical protein